MAGIGFRLQKLLQSDSLSDLVKAYSTASLFSAGPLFVVVAMLSLLRLSLQSELGSSDAQALYGLLVYGYTFSLVLQGPFCFVFTRSLADRIYESKRLTLSALFFSGFIFIAALLFIPSGFFVLSLPISGLARALCLVTFVLLNGIWVGMLVLSAARDFRGILLSFLLGFVFLLILLKTVLVQKGLEGALFVFLLSQFVIFGGMSLQIIREFGLYKLIDFGFLEDFRRHPSFVLIGTFYYIGSFVDKWIYWFVADAQIPLPGLRVNTHYDFPLFLAHLTVLPSISYFIIQAETRFAGTFHQYFLSIRRRETWKNLEQRRLTIVSVLRNIFERFAVGQGLVTLALVIFLSNITEFFTLSPSQFGVLRIAFFGSFLNIAAVMIMHILFYFDRPIPIVVMTGIYASSNFIFTWISKYIGPESYGFGYAASSGLMLVTGIIFLNRAMQRLSYETFMEQPVAIPKFTK